MFILKGLVERSLESSSLEPRALRHWLIILQKKKSAFGGEKSPPTTYIKTVKRNLWRRRQTPHKGGRPFFGKRYKVRY